VLLLLSCIIIVIWNDVTVALSMFVMFVTKLKTWLMDEGNCRFVAINGLHQTF